MSHVSGHAILKRDLTWREVLAPVAPPEGFDPNGIALESGTQLFLIESSKTGIMCGLKHQTASLPMGYMLDLHDADIAICSDLYRSKCGGDVAFHLPLHGDKSNASPYCEYHWRTMLAEYAHAY